jgi:radical SAM protein with 4Fe4S-binding SPASM domain
MGDRKPVVVWNCTVRCNLACRHCYTASSDAAAPDELTTAAAQALLEDLAAFGVPVVLFSGGEPLLRGDLMELIARAAALGMRTVVSTNGTLIDAAAAERLRRAGTSYVGISLDGAEPAHDRLRCRRGAYEAAMKGIRNCRAAGLKVGLRFTLTRHNAADIPWVFALLRDEDIPRACFYHLVYSGRGAAMAGEDLDHQGTRKAVDCIIDETAGLFRQGLTKEILTVDNHADGPYLYLRLSGQDEGRAGEVMALLERTGGNASGTGIGCVSWDGSVHPDQFWRTVRLGNVKQRPFSQIWSDRTLPLLASLRQRSSLLKGRCATCRFLGICSGNSRARAEAVTGDIWGADPACYLTDEEISP